MLRLQQVFCFTNWEEGIKLDYIRIGKIVNTHGIKGELRLLSDFQYKEKVFVKEMHLFIGRKKEEEVITGYRHHKNFEMITLRGYEDINQVLKYKGLPVFVRREDLQLEEGQFLDEDLIGFEVDVDGQKYGEITGIRNAGTGNKLIVIEGENHATALLPFQLEFVSKIDFEQRKVIVTPIAGMFS